MSMDRKPFFWGAPTFSDKSRSHVLPFQTQKSAGVIGGLVEATIARSDKDHVAELYQLHLAASANCSDYGVRILYDDL